MEREVEQSGNVDLWKCVFSGMDVDAVFLCSDRLQRPQCRDQPIPTETATGGMRAPRTPKASNRVKVRESGSSRREPLGGPRTNQYGVLVESGNEKPGQPATRIEDKVKTSKRLPLFVKRLSIASLISSSPRSGAAGTPSCY